MSRITHTHRGNAALYLELSRSFVREAVIVLRPQLARWDDLADRPWARWWSSPVEPQSRRLIVRMLIGLARQDLSWSRGYRKRAGKVLP